jgi:hypothetical protein
MRTEVNETSAGVVAPDKDICKVKDCLKGRIKSRRGSAFCKNHSGLRCQMSKKKFKDLVGNNEVVVDVAPKGKRNGATSKKAKWRLIKNQFLKQA